MRCFVVTAPHCYTQCLHDQANRSASQPLACVIVAAALSWAVMRDLLLMLIALYTQPLSHTHKDEVNSVHKMTDGRAELSSFSWGEEWGVG